MNGIGVSGGEAKKHFQIRHSKKPWKPLRPAHPPPRRIRNTQNLEISPTIKYMGVEEGCNFDHEDANYLPAWQILKNIFRMHKLGGADRPIA